MFNVNRGVFLGCIFSNAVPSSENSLPAWGIRSGWIRRWRKVLTGVFTMGNDLRRLRSNRFGCNKRLVALSEVPWLLRPIHLRPFIWDHSFETTFIWDHYIWDHFHLRPIHLRPLHLRPRSFETTFIWDHVHLRPQSFETTFIWDHIHLRPQSFETTFIWDHIHLRPHSFETTFISDHIHLRPHFISDHIHLRPHFIWDLIHLRPHSFYAMLKWSCFDLLCITFYDLPFTSLRETWSFLMWLFIWNFSRLRPSVFRGDSRWFVNAPALRDWSKGETG